MTDHKLFSIVYHPANSEEAVRIEEMLLPAGFEFEHIKCNEEVEAGTFAARLEGIAHPLLFLISDNFLKSEYCLYNLLQVWQEARKNERAYNILTDGKKISEKNGEVQLIPTDFSRMSGVIQYINFWQESYLDLRSKKREAEAEELEEINHRLRIIRSVSTEVGDFLRVLREEDPPQLNALIDENFRSFFTLTGTNGDVEAYWKQIAEAAEDEITEAQSEPAESAPDTKNEQEETKRKKQTTPDKPQISNRGISSHPAEEIAQELENKSGEAPAQREGDSARDENEWEDILEEPEYPESPDPATSGTPPESRVEITDVDQGEQIFETEIENNPDDIGLHFEYATFLARELGNYPKATRQLDLVLDKDSDHPGALALLGELSELHKDYKSARAYYEQSLEANPYTPDIHYRLGVLLMQQFEGDEKKAAKHLKKAYRQNRQNTDALYRYGIIMDEYRGKFWKAIEVFKKVLNQQPAHPFAHYDLALIYHRMGDLEKAKIHYHEAARINPEVKTEANDKAFGGSPSSEPAVEVHPVESELKPAKTAEKEPVAAKAQTESQDVKTVLITGATSGIGKATAEVFARNGFRLILTGRRKERLNALKSNLLNAQGVDVRILNFDVRVLDSVKSALDSLPDDWATIDILINNAGLAKGLAPIHKGNIDHWEAMIDTNIKGLLYMTRMIAPQMVQRRQGHIINVASTAGKEVYPLGNVYCASKFAVDALTKTMRLDLYKDNIRVSQVAPGHVEETEFAEVRFDGDKEKAKIYEDFQPLKAKDVAEVIFFIATRPSHVNIQDILMMSTQQAGSTFIDKSGR